MAGEHRGHCKEYAQLFGNDPHNTNGNGKIQLQVHVQMQIYSNCFHG